jgi:hypothetical protein
MVIKISIGLLGNVIFRNFLEFVYQFFFFLNLLEYFFKIIRFIICITITNGVPRAFFNFWSNVLAFI